MTQPLPPGARQDTLFFSEAALSRETYQITDRVVLNTDTVFMLHIQGSIYYYNNVSMYTKYSIRILYLCCISRGLYFSQQCFNVHNVLNTDIVFMLHIYVSHNNF